MRYFVYTIFVRHPIKIFRIGKLEFGNGIELRKLVFSGVIFITLLALLILIGLKGGTDVISFLIHNWIKILILIPAVSTIVAFSFKYDNKPITLFFKDRLIFTLTKNHQYEHFERIDETQFEKELQYEAFHIRKKGEVI
ncbi:conjugal transfer protein [Bacillus cereus]|uniref:TcpE family conjugal transfer membrane protein n=1 Tax=Bacillus cereus group TaxID=86661 RepID=UPI00027BFD3A|nr:MULTISPECIES: TcpE family conjugal transfer membrane protein [Bacillus cereus group]EJV89460.1 hypothetical protein IGI_05695 [Bacillus toyonensis]MBJ8113155.1 conjugal transfer protein [Bacillus cereus group sp. N6]PET44838.1 conjugal transfer protein [Bacillus cereus]PFD79367.1 conjugal transfer protein [Bacillus cereus]